jgi:histone-lysine N-methyltransferase SETD3
VPMCDMLNHKRPRETSWTFDDSRGAFTIISLRAMLRGEQIYDSYGRKCNSRFFVNYGFSLEENSADNQAVMWFTLPTSDAHYSMKVRLLGTSKIGVTPNQPKRFQIPMDYSEDVTKECFSFLRFVHAKDSELMLLSSNEKFDVKKIEPISVRNELEVINDLAIAAQTSLSQFDTSIEQDNAILADPTITSNIRNAVLMRRGEKQVLEYYADLANEIRPLFDMQWSQFKKSVHVKFASLSSSM